MTRVICLVIIIVSYAATSFAEQTIRLAISANFINAMEELSNIFVKKYGITIHPIYASTGSLYAMIKNGAPIDLFLAADERRPRLLYEAGLCDRPRVYAMGEVVLWTNQNHQLISAHDWKEAITAGGVDKIALPSPESAPYGACAKWALERVGLFKRLSHQLVYAQSVAQAYQFVEIGGADMGFVPLSYIKKGKSERVGHFWHIQEAPLVVQAMCRVSASTRAEEARIFEDFILSKEAKHVMKRFGYR